MDGQPYRGCALRILILGGDGMLGHRLFLHLRAAHEVRVTLRSELADYAQFGLFDSSNTFPRVDVRTPAAEKTIEQFRPEAVINCAGIVKQIAEAHEAIPSIEVNALLPHRLAAVCAKVSARLIHLSTDCVFSGEKGMYSETDFPDARDLYGRTKLLGEVDSAGCLTIRTSIIGRELRRKTGLLEWLLAQKGKSIRGFKRAIFSGFSTIELSRVIERILVAYPDAHGLYHVSSAPITKFDLLMLLKKELRLDVDIQPDETFHCDRSLDSSRFREAFGYAPPSWESMAAEIAAVGEARR